MLVPKEPERNWETECEESDISGTAMQLVCGRMDGRS